VTESLPLQLFSSLERVVVMIANVTTATAVHSRLSRQLSLQPFSLKMCHQVVLD